MESGCLRYLFRRFSPFSVHKLLPFSSSPGSARYSSFYSGDSDRGSPVYRRALQFQRPPTIVRWKAVRNSVSLIGSICYPLERYAVRNGRFGVYTKLQVKSDRPFRVHLSMWDELAERSFKHLRQSDFVYVSGFLGSYTMVSPSGSPETLHKVIVKELNYVTCSAPDQTCQKPENLDKKEETMHPSSALDRERERLHLWQIFFANPHEWWDNRQGKTNPKRPDFTHRDTRESLWLSPSDPPWVKKQLELHDHKMREQGHRDFRSSRSRVSLWEYKE
ncbi:protein OSB1, mitochondrial-like [Tasmannia lanceolata]|uniref:protein OSB1, mitochondrial-like n=1 Tax=Tasmannia lanceolata TaxID=3420 RepID=UPI0040627D8D